MPRQRSVSFRARRTAAAVAPALAFAVVSGVAPRPLRADSATAEVLFREAKRLLNEGKLDEACPKFAESQRQESSPGTQLNLALCYEKQGKLATAWAEFLKASHLAGERGQKGRSNEAKQRAAAIESKLAYLTVRVVQPPPGLVVKRNGEALEATQFGLRLPADPGEYAITAEASGYKPFRTAVQLKPTGGDVSVEVPALEPETKKSEPVPTPMPPSPEPAKHDEIVAPARARPLVGYVVGGAGIAALGVGATFGLMALSSHSKAEDGCPDHVGCSKSALDDRDKAGTQALVANIGIGAGLVGVGVGAYLIFFSASKPKTGMTPSFSTGVALVPQPAGVGLLGRF
jgi:tetratricopeptide (TPR) repeat protein